MHLRILRMQHPVSASHHYSCIQIFVNKGYYPTVFYRSAQYLYQFAVVYCVEELLQVKVYNIFVTFTYIFLHFAQSIMRPTMRAKATAPITARSVVDRYKYLAYGVLDYSVHYGWNTELTFLAIVLGYLYPTDWIRTI